MQRAVKVFNSGRLKTKVLITKRNEATRKVNASSWVEHTSRDDKTVKPLQVLLLSHFECSHSWYLTEMGYMLSEGSLQSKHADDYITIRGCVSVCKLTLHHRSQTDTDNRGLSKYTQACQGTMNQCRTDFKRMTRILLKQ